jgi:putative copper export protein
MPSGTYVVVWQSQSAFDGHIAGGSFIFRIARPDGTVPSIPAALPTGHVPGAAGNGVPGNTSLDAYTTLQTFMTWLAFLFMTFWVGGLFWETWILPPGKQRAPDLASAARAAHQRFRSLIPITLLPLADLGMVCTECAELAGSWSGTVSLPLLHVVLFESHFGTFW